MVVTTVWRFMFQVVKELHEVLITLKPVHFINITLYYSTSSFFAVSTI